MYEDFHVKTTQKDSMVIKLIENETKIAFEIQNQKQSFMLVGYFTFDALPNAFKIFDTISDVYQYLANLHQKDIVITPEGIQVQMKINNFVKTINFPLEKIAISNQSKLKKENELLKKEKELLKKEKELLKQEIQKIKGNNQKQVTQLDVKNKELQNKNKEIDSKLKERQKVFVALEKITLELKQKIAQNQNHITNVTNQFTTKINNQKHQISILAKRNFQLKKQTANYQKEEQIRVAKEMQKEKEVQKEKQKVKVYVKKAELLSKEYCFERIQFLSNDYIRTWLANSKMTEDVDFLAPKQISFSNMLRIVMSQKCFQVMRETDLGKKINLREYK